jgi:hypothetical protein
LVSQSNAGQTELYVNTFDPHHPAFQEEWGSIMFLSCLRFEPETCFEKHAGKYLPPKKINYSETKISIFELPIRIRMGRGCHD